MGSTLTTPIQNSTSSPSHSNQEREKEIKDIRIKRRKMSLFAGDMIFHIENLKDFQKVARKQIQ